jgi:hypothetical protein
LLSIRSNDHAKPSHWPYIIEIKVIFAPARIVRIATGVANTTPDGVSQMVPDMMANAPRTESFDARGCGNAVMRRGDDQAAVICVKANSRRL